MMEIEFEENFIPDYEYDKNSPDEHGMEKMQCDSNPVLTKTTSTAFLCAVYDKFSEASVPISSQKTILMKRDDVVCQAEKDLARVKSQVENLKRKFDTLFGGDENNDCIVYLKKAKKLKSCSAEDRNLQPFTRFCE